MIVADTNLVSYLLIEGEHTEAARAVWARDRRWVLPSLWRSEYLNVLATTVRVKVLKRDEAVSAWRSGVRLFGRSEKEPDGAAVLHAAIDLGISAYDAQFVVIARELKIPLVTGDRKLLSACGDLAVSLADFVRA
ncbi:MAG: type II toxin-antitoxin system VapC family toxin [Clostridia bacterium]|nr:type II toxin-antitoxin system VapC family toxin [Deltaproteobacteria bacterium]